MTISRHQKEIEDKIKFHSQEISRLIHILRKKSWNESREKEDDE